MTNVEDFAARMRNGRPAPASQAVIVTLTTGDTYRGTAMRVDPLFLWLEQGESSERAWPLHLINTIHIEK